MKQTVESYLEELESRLTLLHEPQRVEIIAEYRAHIAAEVAAGTPESEVLRKFGKPTKVAHQFYTTYGVYERFRKWQYAALGFMVFYLLGLNEYAFGNPSAALNGEVPVSSFLWSLSLVFIGPICYWVMCNRCRGQKMIPLVIAWLIFTVGFCYTTIKIPQYSYESSSMDFAQLPKSLEEAHQLAGASAPMESLAELSNRSTTPREFGKKLLQLQPAILSQARFFHFRSGAPSTYLLPVQMKTLQSNEAGKPSHAVLQFGFTDVESTALAAWKSFSFPAKNLASLIQPSTVEYSTRLKRFTMGSVITTRPIWTATATYFLYVTGIGILFTYLQFPALALNKRRFVS